MNNIPNKENKYRQLFVFDEFDKYISEVHNLSLENYINLVDNVMTPEDADIFITSTLDGDLNVSKNILNKYSEHHTKK
jgi:hypothetical protein